MSKEEKTPEVTEREECLKELNAVLTKYNMSLLPTLQLVPAQKPETEPEEVIEEKDEEGGDS